MRFAILVWGLWSTLECFAMPSARADIYQCNRADGTIHFTNLVPRGGRCKRVVRSSRRARSVSTPSAPSSRSPLYTQAPSKRYEQLATHVEEAARLYQLPVEFLRAVMFVESNFVPDAVSQAGAIGLMQLMPHTAAAMGVQNPFDPRENIFGGARFLRILANKFQGDLALTIAAYNAGEHAVVRHQGVPPYEDTRRYVDRVLRTYYSFRTRS